MMMMMITVVPKYSTTEIGFFLDAADSSFTLQI